LSVSFAREILSAAADTCLTMEFAQLGHTFSKSVRDVVELTGTEIDMLE
jgi:hypothetical protein